MSDSVLPYGQQPTRLLCPQDSLGKNTGMACNFLQGIFLTPEKHLFDYAKAFDCMDHNKLWKILKEWEYQTTWPASWEICMQVRKQQIEPDMEQLTCSKLGKEYVKAVYCHPAYLTNMQSTPWEILDWMKHKLESRLSGEISITSDRQTTPLLRQKAKKN